MNNIYLPHALWLLAGSAVVGIAAVLLRPQEPPEGAVATAPVPYEQFQLLHAEAFEVDKPFENLRRADKPMVTRGWLLVIEGGAEKRKPTPSLERVIYVGAHTAEPINAGASGRFVVIVPGDFRLQDAPIFFGGKEPLETLDQARIDDAVGRAVAGGVTAPSVAVIEGATVAGVKSYPTDFELRRRAIDLVEVHSPEERDLIRSWRVPRIK